MEAAETAQVEQEPEAAPEKQRVVVFNAQDPNHLLTKRPTRRKKNHDGDVVETIEGVHVQFVEHRFETDDPELIEWLCGHPLFNVKFWQEGNAPDEAKPTVAEQNKIIVRASAEQDRAKVEELLSEERQGHNRDIVIQTAEAALRALDGG